MSPVPHWDWLALLLIGGRVRVGGEPFVEGDGEGEEFLLAVEGADHFDVELGVFERGIVEAADVVEEIAGQGGVGVDGGSLEAEVVIVLSDLLIDGRAVDGDRDERDVDGLRAVHVEDAAVELFLGGRRDLVVVGGDELHAGVFEGKGAVAIICENDADGHYAVGEVGQTEEPAEVGVVAGLGRDGNVLVGMSVVGGVLGCGFWGWGGFVGGVGGDREDGKE
jgi:hypothetical protein